MTLVGKKMTTYSNTVRFLHIQKMSGLAPYRLEAAPSIKDWDEIHECLVDAPNVESVESLLYGQHVIRGSYRGWQNYLYPNVRFDRRNPKTQGGNGFAGCPPIGIQEDVELRVNGETYAATVEFV